MPRSLSTRAAVWVALAALALACPGAARAQAEAPAADARRDAARAFREGEKAFAAKDYALAASRFEEANRLAPHPNALWNQARALLRAGDRPRAADAYARYVREAPADARDRQDATRTLEGLQRQLVRLDVAAPGFDTVLVDDRRVEPGPVYEEAGRHRVEGHAGAAVVHEEVSGDAGAVVAVTLAVPAPGVAPGPVPAPAAAPPRGPAPAAALPQAPATTSTPAAAPPPSPTHSGWSPLVVYVGVGATAVLLGVATWSGIDTLSFKVTYDGESRAQQVSNYPAGVDRMNRTNVLFAVAGAGALLTTAAAVWLVDWHRGAGASARVGLGPGAVELRGSFR